MRFTFWVMWRLKLRNEVKENLHFVDDKWFTSYCSNILLRFIEVNAKGKASLKKDQTI